MATCELPSCAEDAKAGNRFCSRACSNRVHGFRPKPVELVRACTDCGESYPLTPEHFRPIDERSGNGWFRSVCRPCERNEQQAYRVANRERRNEQNRAAYQANPERFREARRRHSIRRYGISLDEYDAMLVSQDRGCAVCGTTEPLGMGRFHIDHDHDTGVVRGLLCHRCNTGLGLFGEQPDLLARAIQYLEGS